MKKLSLPRLPKKINTLFPGVCLAVLSLMGIAALITGTLFLVEPTSKPANVLISNLSDHQATVSWVTAQPVKGAVLLGKDGQFSLLPVFTDKLYKDDSEKNLAKSGFYLTHHVTLSGLATDQVYQYKIYEGLREVYTGSFKTPAVFSGMTTPNPVYGRVVEADGRTPAAGAVVYLRAVEGNARSSMVSALTNSEGRWSIDLANLKTEDLKDSFNLSSKSMELVMVTSGEGENFEAKTAVGKDKPWPDIVIK